MPTQPTSPRARQIPKLDYATKRGVVLLVNARRIGVWLNKRSWPVGLRKPGITEVQLTGADWAVMGLFSIGGVTYWGRQL